MRQLTSFKHGVLRHNKSQSYNRYEHIGAGPILPFLYIKQNPNICIVTSLNRPIIIVILHFVYS